MSNSRLKFIAGIIMTVFVVLAASLLLFAKPPEATPTTPSAPTSTSAQPKITWSPTSTVVTLSPGESTARDFTFTSSVELQNVVAEAVPGIAGFLSIQPSNFSSVSAGEPDSVHLLFSIPEGTALGTYNGTIHIKIGNQTSSQTLKVTINVWQHLTDADNHFELWFPPNWQIERGQTVINFFPPDAVFPAPIESPGVFLLSIDSNPQGLTPEQFYDGNHGLDLIHDATAFEQTTINGIPSVRFHQLRAGLAPADAVVLSLPGRFLRFEVYADQAVFESILSTLLGI
jgi:hypothetical protein